MFTLSVIEKSTTSEIIRETFDVALDPDAISGTKESLFIEDVAGIPHSTARWEPLAG
jgi:hypothetical protein